MKIYNLEETENYLNDKGYKKYYQKYYGEDFTYWKVFDGYQVGLMFYDFTKYDPTATIGVQFQCMLLDTDCRVDLSVSKDIEIEEFEKMSELFAKTFAQHK